MKNYLSVNETDFKLLLALFDLIKKGLICRNDILKVSGINKSYLSMKVKNKYIYEQKLKDFQNGNKKNR